MNPLLYVVLGSPGSGRREVVDDLARSVAESDQGNSLLLIEEAVNERAPITGALAEFAVPFRRDGISGLQLVEPVVEMWPDSIGVAFLMFDGLADPADGVEALTGWLPQSGLTLGRILTVVDCGAAMEHPRLVRWLEGCIHFSDAVLLNRRENVPNKWTADFQKRFEKECYPCLFVPVKSGRVARATEVLFPEARRLSQVFDERDDPLADLDVEVEITSEDPDEMDEDDVLPVAEDRFLKRYPGGRRVEPLPAIRQILA